jgi:hypothetical protein
VPLAASDCCRVSQSAYTRGDIAVAIGAVAYLTGKIGTPAPNATSTIACATVEFTDRDLLNVLDRHLRICQNRKSKQSENAYLAKPS